MLITKWTKEVVCEIFFKKGLKNKEEAILLYKIIIPSQTIHYDADNKKFIEEPIKVKVQHHLDDNDESNEGTWPIESFNRFVEGVKTVTDTAKPYIEKNPDFVAQAKISETTYVWSKYIEEKVAGGMFKKTEMEYIQNIKFSILGLQSDYVRWNDDMLRPLIDLKNNFLDQRESFRERINKITLIKNDKE